jgi:hypothetical protein
MNDVLIGYWPFWLLLVLGAGFSLCLARAAALGDSMGRSGLSEREAALAGRPSPAPIEIVPAVPGGWPDRIWVEVTEAQLVTLQRAVQDDYPELARDLRRQQLEAFAATVRPRG